MSTSTIQLPSGFTSGIIAQVTALFGNFSDVVTLILGVLLTAIIIDIIVGSLRRR